MAVSVSPSELLKPPTHLTLAFFPCGSVRSSPSGLPLVHLTTALALPLVTVVWREQSCMSLGVNLLHRMLLSPPMLFIVCLCNVCFFFLSPSSHSDLRLITPTIGFLSLSDAILNTNLLTSEPTDSSLSSTVFAWMVYVTCPAAPSSVLPPVPALLLRPCCRGRGEWLGRRRRRR